VLRADGYRWAERWVPPPVGPVNLFLSPPFPDLQPDRIGEFLKLVNELLAKAPDESVLVIQAEDGFPTDRLPDPPAWDYRKYGRNILLIRVKGEHVEPGTAADNNEAAGENPEEMK
jgi:16S rRNA (guanine966-N2)-methyltransferase